jgi:hypothetical protein
VSKKKLLGSSFTFRMKSELDMGEKNAFDLDKQVVKRKVRKEN